MRVLVACLAMTAARAVLDRIRLSTGCFTAIEVTFTIRPQRRAVMPGTTIRERVMPVMRFNSTTGNETPADVSHTNVQPVFDVYANVQGADLGRVSDKVTKIVNEFRPKLPPGPAPVARTATRPIASPC